MDAERRFACEVVAAKDARPGDIIWLENRWEEVRPGDFDDEDREPVLRRVAPVLAAVEREVERERGERQMVEADRDALREALEAIRDLDYRGNRHPSAFMAKNALRAPSPSGGNDGIGGAPDGH